MNYPLVIVDQRVLGAHVDFSPNEEHELMWKLSYAARDEDDDFRYIEAWLHGCSSEVVFSITIGSILEETGQDYSDEDFRAFLAGNYVSSLIFANARKSAKTLLSLMEEDFPLPDVLEFQSISPLDSEEHEADSMAGDS